VVSSVLRSQSLADLRTATGRTQIPPVISLIGVFGAISIFLFFLGGGRKSGRGRRKFAPRRAEARRGAAPAHLYTSRGTATVPWAGRVGPKGSSSAVPSAGPGSRVPGPSKRDRPRALDARAPVVVLEVERRGLVRRKSADSSSHMGMADAGQASAPGHANFGIWKIFEIWNRSDT
jgi:hypothetical protein